MTGQDISGKRFLVHDASMPIISMGKGDFGSKLDRLEKILQDLAVQEKAFREGASGEKAFGEAGKGEKKRSGRNEESGALEKRFDAMAKQLKDILSRISTSGEDENRLSIPVEDPVEDAGGRLLRKKAEAFEKACADSQAAYAARNPHKGGRG